MSSPESFPRPPHDPANPPDVAIRRTAASWVVRRDRGLSPAESVELRCWLEADARHAAAFERSAGAWSLLAKLPASAAPSANATARRRTAARWVALGGLAAALVLGAFALRVWPGSRTSVRLIAADRPLTRVLSDTSVVQLNHGAELTEEFTSTVRTVRLVRGEAHFAVTHDAMRAFIVRVGPIAVRAVGTAFNVRMQPESIDVLVTEGMVHVGSQPGAARTSSGPLVMAGDRAVVALATANADEAIVVRPATAEEVARELAWREPLLRLGGATLAELAIQFEQKTGRRLVIADPALAELRVGGRFPSDDIEGFVRVLEQSYGVVSTRESDGTLRLGKRP